MATASAVALGCGAFGEQPTSDAGVAPDAGASDASKSDGAPGGAAFCAEKPSVFCSDFEGTNLTAPFGWDWQQEDTASFQWLPGGGVEGGAGLRVQATFPTGNPSRNAFLGRDVGAAVLPVGGKRVELELAFRLGRAKGDYAVLAGLSFFDGVDLIAHHGLAMRIGGVVGGTEPDTSILDQLGSTWHRAKVTLTPTGGTHTRSVTVDGRPGGEVVTDLSAADRVQVLLGVFFSSQDGGELDVVYDDVRLTVE